MLDRRGEVASGLLFLAAAGCGAGLLWLGGYLQSLFLSGLAWQFLLSALPFGTGWLAFRTFRTAHDLKQQEIGLVRRAGADSLFAHLEGIDPARRLARMQRLASLVVDGLLLLVSIALAIHFFGAPAGEVTQAAPGIVFCGLVAFAGYVGGKYLTALGEEAAWSPLKPGGPWLSGSGIFAFAGVVAFGLVHVGWPQMHGILSGLAPFWFLLMAGDRILSLLGSAYGLKEAGEGPGRSRLVEMIADPALAWRSLSEALAYHFGVQLTGRALGRFALKVLLPFGGMTLGGFLLFSCIAWVEPGQTGMIQRFGRQVPGTLQAGFHLKLPWPVDRLIRHDTQNIQSVLCEAHEPDAHDEDHPDQSHAASHGDGEAHQTKVILWAEAHGDQFFFLTPSWSGSARSAGLLVVEASAHFSVDHVLRYQYASATPAGTVRLWFQNALLHVTAGTDPQAFFDARRGALMARIHDRLQAAVQAYGIRIRHVDLVHVHMPVEAAEAFEAVALAKSRKRSLVLAAEAEKRRLESVLDYEKRTLLVQAETEAETRTVQAEGMARLAAGLSPWWEKNKSVLKRRLVMEMLRTLGRNKRKFILPRDADGSSVFEVSPDTGLFFSDSQGAAE